MKTNSIFEQLFSGVYVDSPTDFTVDARAIPRQGDEGRVTCTITNPSGAKTEKVVVPMVDGTYKVSYTPFEEGRHTIDIFYDNVAIPGSPFIVNVRRGCDAKRCKAFGQGLEQGFVNKDNFFTVETKGAGTGGLSLAIEGPSEAKMKCKDNRDGSCTVEYVPTEPGEYDVTIKFADEHIQDSPFKVNVDKLIDAALVNAFGPGLQPSTCRAGVPVSFKIDSSRSGRAPLAVSILSDRENLPKRPDVIDHGDGTYTVTYVPPAEGTNLQAQITWNGQDIPHR